MNDPVLKILLMCRVCKLPIPKREVKFHPTRKWRFDLAWEEEKTAIEYEGLFCRKSRHITVKGYSNDATKYNNAMILGWKVFRFTAIHLRSGEALETLNKLKGLFNDRDVSK